MANPNIVLLYVTDTEASVAFYKLLLGYEPLVVAPNFASFRLDGGFALGLWAKHMVEPAPSADGARTELAFMVKDREAIDALYQEWTGRGLPIAQEIRIKDFGPTFVALDPDGHRLRVCLFDE